MPALADKPPAEKNLRLADRVLIHSILIEIFGKSEQQLLREQVLYQNQAFGGPCDVYEQVRILGKTNGVLDPDTFCANGRQDFSTQVIAKPNMHRYGYTAFVCNHLTQSKVAMHFALSKLFSKNAIKAPNPNNLLKAYRLFNPEKNVDSKGLLASFKSADWDQKSIFDQWTEIFLVLCDDPSWQII